MICDDCKYRNQDESAWPCKNCTPDDRRFEAETDAEMLRRIELARLREATLLGKVERQSAALKLAREALIGALSDDQPYINASKEALAAINEVLKGE